MKKFLLLFVLMAFAVVLPACSIEILPDEDTISHAEYVAVDDDTPVVISGYVQAKQSWWNDSACLYLQDQDGGYFVYNASVSEEMYKQLETGVKVKVTGTRSSYKGELEIAEGATVEILEDEAKWVATATDVTSYLGTDDMIDYQNEYVKFDDVVIAPSIYTAADGTTEERAFLYKWDGSGDRGSDLYFNIFKNGKTYTFTVESYLCGVDTEVYQAVEALKIGDKLNMEGFAYWYDGLNPHITKVEVVK